MVTNNKEYMAEWRKNNKDKIKQYSKTFREKHGPVILTDEQKEKQKEYMIDYRRANKDHLRKMKKLQIASNPDYAASLKISKINWRLRNPEHANEYNKRKRASDPNFKLRMILRTRLYQILKLDKKASALSLLGCSIEEFKSFIASSFTEGMSWDNHGEWELDHVKPLALFNLLNMNEQIEAFHFTNFQPLWKSDNRSKKDKYEIQN